MSQFAIQLWEIFKKIQKSKIESCFLGLDVLVFPWNMVLTTVFNQICAGLMKIKLHACLSALYLHIKNPIEVQRSGVFAGLSSNRDFLNQSRIEVSAEAYLLYHWRDNNHTVLDWQREKYRHTVIRTVLILHSAADADMVVAFAPVLREALHKPFYALCEEIECAISSLADNIPDFISPFIGFLNQKIGGEPQSKLRA